MKCIACAIIWFNIILGYYGILFVFPSFIEDVYLEGMILSIAEGLATYLTAYAVNAVGRKQTAIFCFVVAGLSFFAIWMSSMWLTGNTSDYAILAASFLARFAICGEFFMIFIYTTELFPTSIRNMAFGICNFIGRLGGLLASNLFSLCVLIGVKPSLVLAITLSFAAVVSFFIEETFGKDIDEEDENLEKVD